MSNQREFLEELKAKLEILNMLVTCQAKIIAELQKVTKALISDLPTENHRGE